MPRSTANATWDGSLTDGDGRVALGDGAWEGRYATPDVDGATDPKELLAAGHASCYAMTLAYVLRESGYDPDDVRAESTVVLERGADAVSITRLEVSVEAAVPEATVEVFATGAEEAEQFCPVSRALAGTDIDVEASLAN